jgi:hypothetical protein
MLRQKLWWVEKAVYEDGEYSSDQFLTLWICWLMEHEFLKVFGQLEGYIIVRPVRVEWVFDTDTDYFATLFRFDPAGDTAWIDSLWAPGRFAEVRQVLKATRRKFVAWEHGESVRCLPVSELKGDMVTPSQLRDSLVRYCSP